MIAENLQVSRNDLIDVLNHGVLRLRILIKIDRVPPESLFRTQNRN